MKNVLFSESREQTFEIFSKTSEVTMLEFVITTEDLTRNDIMVTIG